MFFHQPRTAVRLSLSRLGTGASAPAQTMQGNTQNHSWWGHQERVCELRTTTIKLGGTRLGAKSENGGIEVTGEDRSDVLIEARVEAWAGSESDARNILKQVVINTSGDRIRDDGPAFSLGKFRL